MKEVQKIHATGWFGIPGGNRGTKVHCVTVGNKPACGARLHPKSAFQFCSAGIKFDYLECEKCKSIANKVIELEEASRKVRFSR